MSPTTIHTMTWSRENMARLPDAYGSDTRPNLMLNLRSVQRRGRTKTPGATTKCRANPMWIMVVYILIVLVGETITVAIGLVLDRIFPSASLTVSLTLFFAILWLAWVLAVRLTEPKNAKTAKHA